MDKQLGLGLNPKEKLALLQNNCEKVEQMGYTRSFSEEEIVEMKDELANKSIEQSNLSEEKKVAMASFKAKLQPVSARIGTLLKNLREKAEYTNESLFKFVDTEEKMVGYYNSDGELIDSLTRRAKPDELQGNIFLMDKTGTHN